MVCNPPFVCLHPATPSQAFLGFRSRHPHRIPKPLPFLLFPNIRYSFLTCIVFSDTHARGTNPLECNATTTKGRRTWPTQPPSRPKRGFSWPRNSSSFRVRKLDTGQSSIPGASPVRRPQQLVTPMGNARLSPRSPSGDSRLRALFMRMAMSSFE